MPAPIPPPPPQASVDETRRAVRLARTIYAVTILLFLMIAATYSPTGFPIDRGRESSLGWNLWKLEQLDVDALRAGGDGRVAWLVGPSVLREAVDEQVAQDALDLGVAKFGFNRGASGLASGFLDRLPIQTGDVVVHSVAANNFRRDWIDFVDIPHWWLTELFAPADFWSIGELSVQERLEGSVNYAPSRFWVNHDDTQEGWKRWAKGEDGRSGARHIRHSNQETTPGFSRWRLSESAHQARELSWDRWDAGPDQFNVWGLDRLEATCRQRGATLVLIEVPPTDEMVRQLMAPEALEAWGALKDERGVVRLSKVPDADYADFMHPGPRAREVLTREVVELLRPL